MKNFCGNKYAVVFDDSNGWSAAFPHLAMWATNIPSASADWTVTRAYRVGAPMPKAA